MVMSMMESECKQKELIEVSIIICTYNPVFSKLISTIEAAVGQKNVKFEIIISDDGSDKDYFELIDKYFERISFKNYQLIKNECNVGTVKNALNAIRKANGEYIFMDSPGDIIFDEYVISDFYRFSKERNADICFGNYVPYYIKDDKLCYSNYLKPKYPNIYYSSYKNYKASFFTIEYILGASYFRSRKFLLDSLEFIKDYARFAEDTPTSIYALAQHKPINYYNRSIVWYEYGCGVSTSGDSNWGKRLFQDFISSYKAIQKKYPKDRYVQAGLFYLEHAGERNFTIKFSRTFPIIAIRRRIAKIKKKRIIDVTEQNEKYLYVLLHQSEGNLQCMKKKD